MFTNRDAKQTFLVVHDYGMGGLWCYLSARSESEIHQRYQELKVVDETPSWLTKEESDRLARYDIDEAPSGWLAKLLRAP